MNVLSKTGRAFRRLSVRGSSGKKSLLEFALIFVLLFLMKRDVLDLAYVNDSALHVVNTAKWIMENNYWPYAQRVRGLISHPPFFYWVLVFFYRIFGFKPFSAHLATVFFSAVCLFFTYRLGRILDSVEAGFTAALLLLFHPLYFAQSGIANLDLALASLTVVSLYFALEGRWIPYFFTASCMVLTKETAVFFFPILLAYHLIFVNRDFRDAVKIMLPLGFLILWSVGNRMVYGWFLLPHHNDVVFKNARELLFLISNPSIFYTAHYGPSREYLIINNLWGLNRALFTADLLILFLFVALYSILHTAYEVIHTSRLGKSKRHEKAMADVKTYALLLSLSILYVFLYLLTADGASLIRYILPTLPFYFLLIAITLKRNLSKYRVNVVLIIIACIFFYTRWYELDRHITFPLNAERNMVYSLLTRNEMDALRFVEKNHSTASILNKGFAIRQKVIYPYTGYVTRPINFILPAKLEEVDLNETEVYSFDHKLEKFDGLYMDFHVSGGVYQTKVECEFSRRGIYTYLVRILYLKEKSNKGQET
jgi:4-amino-4-deoxy-L-arabinose transferase-like glycosyltransferase